MIRYFILIFVVFYFLSSGILKANESSGLYFLKLNKGSRALGMGNAYTALSSDLNGIYFNPSGIGFLNYSSIMFFHSNWIEDISIENFAFSFPYNKFNFSGGINYLHMPMIDKYEIDPLTGSPIESGQFSANNFVFQMGLAYRFNWNLALGFQLKFFQDNIDNYSASGFAFDVGLLYKLPIDYFRLGFAIQNIGQPVRYDKRDEKLPQTFRAGIAYQLPYHTITFSLDAVKTRYTKTKLYFGAEFEFLNSFFLRSGVNWDNPVESNYYLGLGFKILDNYEINYAFLPMGILGNTHHFEFTFKFGRSFRSSSNKFKENNQRKEEILRTFNKNQKNILNKKSKQLIQPPTEIKYLKVNDQIFLVWNDVKIQDVKYNVYVKSKDSNKLFKITDTPITDNYIKFKSQNNKLNLTFFVTTVFLLPQSGKIWKVIYQNQLK